MTGGREAARRPTRAPLRQRNRRRWALAAGVAACWLILEVVTGSVVSATVVLMVIAALAAAGVGGLRALGITSDHPWIRRMASRPWRDGQDVLRVAMRHLADVFVVTPSGVLLAPNLVELQLNPDDLDSLCTQMELGVISASMTEVYEEQIIKSGARAGRGPVELVLPDILTLSREHATFTFSDGRWWITNLGRNGLTLNGVPVAGEQPLSDGDTIRWGASPDALLSHVKIG